MFSFGVNCNNIENYTIGTIAVIVSNLGYTSTLFVDNNDINYNMQTHELVDFV